MNPFNPAKVLAAVQAAIIARIAYAESPSAGIGEGSSAMPIYQASGFDTAQDYLAARDDTYQLLASLLEAGRE